MLPAHRCRRVPRRPRHQPGAEHHPARFRRKALTSIDPANHRLRLDRLTVYSRAAAHILQEWDDYTETSVDEQGWPLDDLAHGRRQRQRDADTWRAFEHLHPHLEELLTLAERQLAELPAAERQPVWRSALARLDEARIALENAQALWQSERHVLPATAVPGTEAYDELLAERNAEAWGYLCDWADGGHVLTRIARAAAQAHGPAGPPAEHTRAQNPAALPPQPPGHLHHRGPR